TASGSAVDNGATDVSSWTAIAQTGDTGLPETAGTMTTAWALCVRSSTPATSVDLSLVDTAAPSPATIGLPLTYTLTATNAGPATATGVELEDVLPAASTFVSADPAQGSCLETSGTVTCELGSIGQTSSASVQIVVRPNAAATLVDDANVTSNEEDL